MSSRSSDQRTCSQRFPASRPGAADRHSVITTKSLLGRCTRCRTIAGLDAQLRRRLSAHLCGNAPTSWESSRVIAADLQIVDAGPYRSSDEWATCEYGDNDGEADSQAIERIALGRLGRRYVQHDQDQCGGEKDLGCKCLQDLDLRPGWIPGV